jgi:hypothetical protein
MSNYALSVLNTGQALLKKNLNEAEQRRKMPSVFELAIKNQEFSIPNAQELRVSPLRPVEIYYMKDVAAGAGTAKAYNHTGTYGDSGSATVTYVQYVETFSLPQKLAYNNRIGYEQMFNNLYEMKWKNLRTRHDTAALAFLYNNRVQLAAATINPQLASANAGAWDDTNKALVIPDAKKSLFLSNSKAAMASRYMNMTGQYDCVADLQMAANFNNYMNQGAGNQANLTWQFDNVAFAVTQDVIDTNYALGSTLWLPKGMFAGLYWNEGLNKTGLRNDDIGGTIGMIGTIDDPFGSGARADISMYTQRADTSANTTGGSTQDFVDQWELTLTVGYVLPPLSTANDSVVMEIVQAGTTA